MGLSERIGLYRRLEQRRKRPVIVYITSPRPNAEGGIAGDAVHELELQLQQLPSKLESLDLLIVSNGGDATVAWRVVSLIRERVKRFSVLIPSGAFSAATLIALGADSLVIHCNGNLGPVDPQIHTRRRSPQGGEDNIAFGSEDLSAFLTYARDTVGLSDQQYLSAAFAKFCDQVGTVPIGMAARSAQLSVSMAEKLLKMHVSAGATEQRAKTIAEKLSREYYHHGYALSRTEARDIGLEVEESEPEVDDLIWRIWLEFVTELQARAPFEPIAAVRANPAAAPVFGPVPSLNIPAGMPPPMVQAILSQAAQQAVVQVPPTDYRLVGACLESARAVSHFVTEGVIFVLRTQDSQLKFNMLSCRSGWRDVELPTEVNVCSATEKDA